MNSNEFSPGPESQSYMPFSLLLKCLFSAATVICHISFIIINEYRGQPLQKQCNPGATNQTHFTSSHTHTHTHTNSSTQHTQTQICKGHRTRHTFTCCTHTLLPPSEMLMGGFGRGISLSSSQHAVRLSDQWLAIVPGLQPRQGLWITYWQSCVRWTKHGKTHSHRGSAGENKKESRSSASHVNNLLSILHKWKRETKMRWPLNPRSLLL